ncbi:SdpI family protein [Nocardioides sp. P5_E3]
MPLLVLTAALSAVCLLQFVMTRLGATQGMGPNRLDGFKTKATLASDGAWRAGHAAAQPALLTAAVTGLGVAIPLALRQASSDADPTPAFTVVCALAAVAVAVLFGLAVHRANRAARQVTNNGGEKEMPAGDPTCGPRSPTE